MARCSLWSVSEYASRATATRSGNLTGENLVWTAKQAVLVSSALDDDSASSHKVVMRRRGDVEVTGWFARGEHSRTRLERKAEKCSELQEGDERAGGA